MRKKYLTASLFVAAALPFAAAHGQGIGAANGHRPPINPTQAAQWRQSHPEQQPGQKGQGFTSATCQNIVTRIQNRVSNYQTNENARVKVFEDIQDRLTKIENKYSADGLDTVQLKIDLATLNTKINKFTTDYGTFISALQSIQPNQCATASTTNSTSTTSANTTSAGAGEAPGGNFRALMNKSITILPTLRQDVADIRSFFISTIIPDIQKLQTQDATKTNSGSSTDNKAL